MKVERYQFLEILFRRFRYFLENVMQTPSPILGNFFGYFIWDIILPRCCDFRWNIQPSFSRMLDVTHSLSFHLLSEFSLFPFLLFSFSPPYSSSEPQEITKAKFTFPQLQSRHMSLKYELIEVSRPRKETFNTQFHVQFTNNHLEFFVTEIWCFICC